MEFLVWTLKNWSRTTFGSPRGIPNLQRAFQKSLFPNVGSPSGFFLSPSPRFSTPLGRKRSPRARSGIRERYAAGPRLLNSVARAEIGIQTDRLSFEPSLGQPFPTVGAWKIAELSYSHFRR